MKLPFTKTSRGNCEWGSSVWADLYPSGAKACGKRARWYDGNTGALLCGEHKQAATAARKSS